MPIPALNADGLLPAGVHAADLQELLRQFGRFSRTEARPRLASRLAELVGELPKTGLVRALVLDGSFVTSKEAPEDVDLILVLAAGHDWEADLGPDTYRLLSRRQNGRRFGFDVLVAEDASVAYEEYVQFFSRVREDAALRKGLVRIEL
ncbi:MAG TPA: hypothetical protein PKE47_05470 [Verrucomicrobiota bacterium]|nr:hypothetical protein [Verrucomicrobiota bacterium]